MRSLLGVYGGTFDPVHFGHLRTAVEVREALGLEQVRLIPSGIPPHRGQPRAPAADRLAMVRLAAADEPGLVVDDREVKRSGPCYTVDTLLSLREEAGDAALCLIIGMDAFLSLDSWHHWRKLPELAHIIIMHRPGWIAEAAQMAMPVRELFESARVDSAEALCSAPAGRLILQAVTPLDISATAIREAARAGRSLRYLTPDAVVGYIRQRGLYRET